MAFWDSWFGGSDADDAFEDAQRYLNEYKPMLEGYYNPYIEYGNRAMPTLEQQYQQLLQNPGALYSSLGQGFQTSPGYQFGVDQALQGSNAAMASAGMLGTPAHQQQNMNYANQLANQEYNNYMSRMLGLYGTGLEGTQGQFNTGYGATNQLASGMGNLYGSMANLAFNQGASNAANSSSLWGAGLGALGTIGGAALGSYLMPGAGTTAGAAAGESLASGGWMPNKNYMLNWG